MKTPLLKLTPVVNVINILRAIFFANILFLAPKFARKTLMKLTPDDIQQCRVRFVVGLIKSFEERQNFVESFFHNSRFDFIKPTLFWTFVRFYFHVFVHLVKQRKSHDYTQSKVTYLLFNFMFAFQFFF